LILKMGIIIGLIANILGLYLAESWVPGFSVMGGWKELFVTGLVLGILNWILRPIIKLVTFPLIALSLGLFLIVINAIIIWLTSQFTGFITIENYIALLWATLLISIINLLAKPFK